MRTKSNPRRPAGELLGYLLSGDPAPGQRIPSERALAQALNVGRGGAEEGWLLIYVRDEQADQQRGRIVFNADDGEGGPMAMDHLFPIGD